MGQRPEGGLRQPGFGGGQQQAAAVAASYAGDFSVAWESDHTGTRGVWARSFTAAGNLRHAEVEAAPGATGARIGVDDQANAVVGWSVPGADPQVWVRGLNPDGTGGGRLAAQQLSQATAGRQEQIAVAVSPWAEVSVCYTDDNDGNQFDQVILGIGATNTDW